MRAQRQELKATDKERRAAENRHHGPASPERSLAPRRRVPRRRVVRRRAPSGTPRRPRSSSRARLWPRMADEAHCQGALGLVEVQAWACEGALGLVEVKHASEGVKDEVAKVAKSDEKKVHGGTAWPTKQEEKGWRASSPGRLRLQQGWPQRRRSRRAAGKATCSRQSGWVTSMSRGALVGVKGSLSVGEQSVCLTLQATLFRIYFSYCIYLSRARRGRRRADPAAPGTCRAGRPRAPPAGLGRARARSAPGPGVCQVVAFKRLTVTPPPALCPRSFACLSPRVAPGSARG